MPLSITDGGTTTTDGTELDLFAAQTTEQHYAMWINTTNMVAGDDFTFRIYVLDKVAGTEEIYIEDQLLGAQTPVMYYAPWVPTDSYRVSVQRNSGTNRQFDWRRLEF